MFGSHVALLLRRLLRVCARYGAAPTLVLASATVADPAAFASRLTGRAGRRGDRGRVAERGPHPRAVGAAAAARARRRERRTRCGGPRAPRPPACSPTSWWRAPARSRSCGPAAGPRWPRSSAQRLLADVDTELVERVAAYRGGYLPEERRALEAALAGGDLLGVATTNALELGVDIAGLDAVVVAGFPGTRASFWQQAGRAGRARDEALVVLVARDDPLDTYLVHHPEALLGAPVEGCVLDPGNPYVLGPQLACAAAELPLTEADLAGVFSGTGAEPVLDELVADGVLRRRPAGLVLALDRGPPGGHRGHPRLRARTGGRGRGGHRADARHGGRRLGTRHRARRRGLPAPRRELPGAGPRSRRRGRAGARRRPRTGAPTPARRPTSKCPQCSPAGSAARCGWRSAR